MSMLNDRDNQAYINLRREFCVYNLDAIPGLLEFPDKMIDMFYKDYPACILGFYDLVCFYRAYKEGGILSVFWNIENLITGESQS